MSRHLSRHTVGLVAVALASFTTAGCGDDDPETSTPAEIDTPDAGGADRSGGPVSGSRDPASGSAPSLDEAISSLSLDTRADAMFRAVGANQYKVEGTVVHLHFDDAEAAETSACIGGGAILEEGESIVLHSPGVEIPC